MSEHESGTNCGGTMCPACGCCQHTPLSQHCDCGACSCRSLTPLPNRCRTTDQTDRPQGASE